MSETTWSDGGSEGTAQGVLSLVLVLDAGRTGPACRQAGVERVLDALHQGLRAGWHGVIVLKTKSACCETYSASRPAKYWAWKGAGSHPPGVEARKNPYTVLSGCSLQALLENLCVLGFQAARDASLKHPAAVLGIARCAGILLMLCHQAPPDAATRRPDFRRWARKTPIVSDDPYRNMTT